MLKKIIIASIITLIALLPVCNSSEMHEHNPYESTDVSDEHVTDEDSSDDNPQPPIKLELLKTAESDLIPDFDPDILSYNITLTPEVSGITITARPPLDCFAGINNIVLTSEESDTVVPITQSVTEITITTGNRNREGLVYSLNVLRMEERLIENPSFEISDSAKHPSGWELTGAGECISTNEFCYSGNSSATFTTLTGSISGREILSSHVEIEQGKKINVLSRFYLPVTEGGSPERIKISIKLYYFTDEECLYPALAAYDTMAKCFLNKEGVWETINYYREIEDIPADARFLRIGLRACYDSLFQGGKYDRVYFDSVSIQQ